MSEWRNLWAKAIRANQVLSTSYISDGEKVFNNLLRENKDGMLFYERAEGYEFRNKRKEAIEDYKMAKELFPAPHWKKVADLGILRINEEKNDMHDIFYEQWNTFHLLHTKPYIPHSIRVNSFTAIEIFDSLPDLSAGIIRNCLEQSCEIILDENKIHYKKTGELVDKIGQLYSNHLIDNVIFTTMEYIRKKGNDGVHARGSRGCEYYFRMLDNYFIFISFLNNENFIRSIVQNEITKDINRI